KTWQEDAARNTMIKVFELLGKGDPMASRYRRRMFTLLH
ncbi:MAG: tetratricopeptide repeat protein, partial [Pseudomonadales bacterium]